LKMRLGYEGVKAQKRGEKKRDEYTTGRAKRCCEKRY